MFRQELQLFQSPSLRPGGDLFRQRGWRPHPPLPQREGVWLPARAAMRGWGSLTVPRFNLRHFIIVMISAFPADIINPIDMINYWNIEHKRFSNKLNFDSFNILTLNQNQVVSVNKQNILKHICKCPCIKNSLFAEFFETFGAQGREFPCWVSQTDTSIALTQMDPRQGIIVIDSLLIKYFGYLLTKVDPTVELRIS